MIALLVVLWVGMAAALFAAYLKVLPAAVVDGMPEGSFERLTVVVVVGIVVVCAMGFMLAGKYAGVF